ncbi:MAG: M48 family metalloprotease [Thermodesulfobacteriota bacterium]
MTRSAFFLLLLTLLAGCAINPVTGQREMAFVGEQQEIAIGREQYEPGRQMEGGDYRVDPQLNAYVNEVGQKLAGVSDRPLPYEFTVLTNSVPNAWALPGGKIAINRGLLLELNNEAELAAVLSHEIVHSAARHGAQRMERGILMQGALLATAVAVADRGSYGGLAVGGAQLAATLIGQRYSREAELEADYYGMQYMARAGYDPRSAVSLQETFVRLAEGKESNWLNGLFASHPPSRERVEANRRTGQSLPPGGEIGATRYQEKITYIKKTAPAYKAYEKGVLALKKGDAAAALSLADEAKKIEPREALFHGLRAEALSRQGRYQQALDSCNQALGLNDRFFHFYLQRGQIREKLGDLAGARQDLEQSAKLLPTAESYKKLGDMALAANNRTGAKDYYLKASSSGSQAGKEAAVSFLRLDLPENPGKHLQLRIEEARDGSLQLRLTNPTSVAIEQIQVAARYRDAAGATHDISRTHQNVLQPGGNVTIPLGDTIPGKQKHTIQAHIVGARVAR